MFALPDAFSDKMKMLMKDEWKAFADAFDAPAHKGIRRNTLKIDEQSFKRLVSFVGTPVPWCRTGYEIDSEILENTALRALWRGGGVVLGNTLHVGAVVPGTVPAVPVRLALFP